MVKQNISIEEPEVSNKKNNLYPIFLKLDELNALVVGGGNVGLEKVNALLFSSPDANVTIVAPAIKNELKEAIKHHITYTIVERKFEDQDLEGKDIAILASDDKELHKHIKQLARKNGILCNVADTPELCDFYLSSVVKKGNLKIAISTNGKSPTIAKRLKETFNQALPDEIDQVLDNMQSIRNKLNGNFAEKVKKLNRISKVLVESEQVEREKRIRKIATYSILSFALMLVGHFIFSYVPFQQMADDSVAWYKTLDDNFHWMLLAGFLAQLVDGALGMGYGVTSATVLLSTGISPVAISGSIHTAETFAAGVSGYSHYKFGNVNKKLFKALVIPGVIGAVVGAILLVLLGDKYGNHLRPVIAVYTLFLGIKFILNAFRQTKGAQKFKHYSLLATVGGFFDSFGGGGWGPIVTSTLINNGRSHKYVIGSVSLTEFFITLASAFTFFTMLGVSHWQVIVALMIGGTIAAPLAAKLAGKIPKKTSYLLLGILVIFWSIRILIKVF
jgi:uncharacterized protein